jgi:hypothetical protein
MGIVGRLDQYASMLSYEFDETTANNTSITGLGTYYSTEFNENIVDIVRDGLVLNLDAGNLASYPGSGTTWTDVSSNGNNGTLTNGPTYSSVNGGSIVFDGVDDVVNTSYGPQLNDFTVIAWFRSTGGTLDYNRIVDKDYINGLWIGRNATNANSWGGGVLESSAPYGRYITLTDNQWHMIVSRRQGTTHTIYGDGITNSASGTVSSTALSTATFSFGNWYNQNAQRLTGNISQVSIYNRALTEAEIQQNYNALATRYGLTTTGTTAPMVANVFPPYDLVYDEFGGTFFGAGQGRYMRQNTDKSVIVYNEIDEVTDFYGRGIVRGGLLLDLDAGISSSYPGSGTTWTDLTANSTIANLSSTTYTTDAGGGIYFSSSASSANFTATLNFSGGFTLETWIKHTGVVSTARVQRYMTIGSSPLEGPVLRHNSASNGSLHGYLFDSGSTFREIDIAGQILTNTYYHLVYTYDGTTFRLYKNNVQVGTLVATVTLPTLGTTHGLAPGGVEYFEGNMYAARYYNRALTAAEILQNYNALKGRFGL